LWSALYWWNPLVIKELFNSGHMDGLVSPLVLLALLLATRRRQLAASATLACAVGAKIWPVLLLPLILRPLITAAPRKLAAALAIFAALVALLAVPVLLGGLDAASGFTAYLTRWQTSSALFPVLNNAWAALLSALGTTELPPGPVARATIAVILGGLACALSLKPIADPDDLIGRASLTVAALVLLSPAQFPWYAVWLAPFLAFRPCTGFLILTATAPLYYLLFYLIAAGEPGVFTRYVVWIIWVPVWAALLIEALRRPSLRTA
jgi:alpha-1,6-mannosyltransferase